MYKLLSNLVMYRIEDKDSIIVRLADIIRDYDKMSVVTGNAINEGNVTETESGIYSKNTSPEELRDRIKSECELTLHEAMRPSEITFLVSLPRDSKGGIDYEAVKDKIEMIQADDLADEAIADAPMSE